MNTNYSYETSLNPYKENKVNSKDRQCDKILDLISPGANNLLQISIATGIPQSIVSARVNDLINEGKVEYKGIVFFNNRQRKKIVLVSKMVVVQREFF